MRRLSEGLGGMHTRSHGRTDIPDLLRPPHDNSRLLTREGSGEGRAPLAFSAPRAGVDATPAPTSAAMVSRCGASLLKEKFCLSPYRGPRSWRGSHVTQPDALLHCLTGDRSWRGSGPPVCNAAGCATLPYRGAVVERVGRPAPLSAPLVGASAGPAATAAAPPLPTSAPLPISGKPTASASLPPSG